MNFEYIYFAGLFDGEGTVTLQKKHKLDKFRTPVLSLTSTTFELVEFCQKNFGGFISKQTKKKEHFKESWSWKISGNKALLLCFCIKDFVLEPSKKYRINHLLEHYKKVTIRNGRYNEEQLKNKIQFEHDFFNMPVQ